VNDYQNDLILKVPGGTMKNIFIVIAALMFLGSTAASAAEQFGVTIYPGAVSDAAAKAYCVTFGPESIKQTRQAFRDAKDGGSFCFHTKDDFDKVVAYYMKQTSIEPMGAPSIRGVNKAMLYCAKGMKCASLGDGVDVTVSTPWSVGATTYKDVLITISKATH
jgi:hypothetical protein